MFKLDSFLIEFVKIPVESNVRTQIQTITQFLSQETTEGEQPLTMTKTNRKLSREFNLLC
jgi:hypothetical protein